MLQFLGLSTAGPGVGTNDSGSPFHLSLFYDAIFKVLIELQNEIWVFCPHSEAQSLKMQPKSVLMAEILQHK